jgi:hypothetical protein
MNDEPLDIDALKDFAATEWDPAELTFEQAWILQLIAEVERLRGDA